MQSDIHYYLARYFEFFPFLLPLGYLGIWRWSVWAIKKTCGFFYKPQQGTFKTTVSLITPVYNENPKILTQALQSWKENGLKEIIAVIDYSDKVCIKLFKDFARKNKNARLIVTKKPGKRPALADGIKIAKGEIVALVDSDTIWEKDTLKNGLVPFNDKKIGGVATKQSIVDPGTLAQKLFSISLEQRYWDDIPFLAATGDVLVCLSGRTAFYRKKAVYPFLDKLVNEFFMGQRVISGEDKRLTYLIEEAGWKTTYQSTSLVATPGEKNLKNYLNQQIRWTRNSWRADLKALGNGWVFKHPIFAVYLIDRAVQPFTLLISPIYFIVSLALHLWIPVITILAWWTISRGIKMIPHLKKYPTDIWVLPLFIFFNFVSAYIRLYALFSLNVQGWITRWDKSRMNSLSIVGLAGGHVVTIFLCIVIATSVFLNKNRNYIVPQRNQAALVASTFVVDSKNASGSAEVAGTFTLNPETQLSKRYVFKDGDSLSTIAAQYGATFDNLLIANVNKITNWNRIPSGTVLTIPPPNITLISLNKFNYRRIYSDPLGIVYDTPTDSIIITGRGQKVTLSQISQSVGTQYLEEVSPKVWLLKASLYLRSGTTLSLDKNEVEWLKMRSNAKSFVTIRTFSADISIDGVKVTSWDEEKKTYDTNLKDGRSYVLVKDGARMDITDGEMAYLGYPRPKTLPYSPYGVSWRMSLGKRGSSVLTGEVKNSTFHHNYFGAYTFGATGMLWTGNTFRDNVRYGLDPHDDSNGFLVENNTFMNNGSHGLIFSKRCINNVIRNNVSHDNKLHGIMLHELSNNNIIENNTLYNNRDGVALDHSSNNLVRNNSIKNNIRGVRANKKAKGNSIDGNTISNSKQYGLYFYGGGDENVARYNLMISNNYGAYIKTNRNILTNNQIKNGSVGIYLVDNASGNVIKENQIDYNTTYGIYAKITSFVTNVTTNNSFTKNYFRDIFTRKTAKN